MMLLCMFINTEAKELSLTEVMNRVQSTSQANVMRKAVGNAGLRISHVQRLKDKDKVAYYVLDKVDAQGFIIAPADDVFPVVLGYTDSGDFDIDSIPPALKWYLEQFEKTVDKVSSVYSIVSTAEFSEDWTPIEPLLTTKWGQGYPYNLDCPSYNGYQSATGCVPTAVAQIMNYHKWPDVGEGSGSTNFSGNALTLDFESVSFDWVNMEDEYDNNSTDQAKKAVAELMYGCGIGIKACYGYGSMTGGSVIGAKYFLTENMKYDSSMKLCYRYNYSPYEWNELIYHDLSNGLPVYCEGGHHAFVCDGYGENGYFHINWGWEGYADGYFLLSDLNPTSDKDNYQEEMITLTNIQKRNGSKQPLTVDLINKGEFKINSYGLFAFDNIFNYSLKDFNGYFGVKAVSKENDCYYFESKILQNITAAQLGGFSVAIAATGRYDYYGIPLEGKLPAGEYRLYQVYREKDGDYCDIRGLYGSPNYIDMNVDETGGCTFLPQEFNYDIEVTDVVVNDGYGFKPGLAYAGHVLYDLSMTFVNNMDVPYNSGMTYRITKNDELIATGETSWLLKPHSESRTGLGNGIGGDHIFEEGEYKIEFFDYGGKKIDRKDFFFSVIEEPTPNLEVTEFSWEKNDKYDWLTLSFTVYNLSEYHYQGEFEIVIDPPVFENRHVWINGVEGGGTVKLDWDFWDAESTFTEDAYQVYLYDHHGQQINKTPLWLYLKDIEVTEIELSTHEWIGKIGDSFVIEAKVLPENAADKTLEWASSNEEVAIVDESGLVTAIGQGSATITVTCGEASAQCEIIVLDENGVESILANPNSLISIYSVDGVIIKKDANIEDLRTLVKGVYIIVSGKDKYKVSI